MQIFDLKLFGKSRITSAYMYLKENEKAVLFKMVTTFYPELVRPGLRYKELALTNATF